MIETLAVTILVEGVIGLAYSLLQKRSPGPILVTSFIANLITQSLLWMALNIFFQHYLIALWIAEFFIWLVESVLFFVFRWNQLTFRESLFLSLLMNLSSFGIGWLLPV
ncbi:MAG: hypothetical protein Q7J80_15170 [Anaerolineales bacterium]|nr:hypothetical protein [Anaerolineales bacterium]